MKKSIIGVFIVFLILIGSGVLEGAIPAIERAALIALYNSTNGDNWVNHSGWKTPPLASDGFAMPGTEESWNGVTLTVDNVTIILIQWNRLSGSIPVELSNLTYLRILDLSWNTLSGSIPTELSKLTKLQSLDLSSNQLTGTIPVELGNLSNLQTLYLGCNQLSGSIPAELGNLSSMQTLNLGLNKLSGSIPAELGNLSSMQELYLYVNQLSSIPPEIGNLSNLHTLDLSGNQLSSIPPEIGNLSKLHTLDWSGNQLSSISPEIGNLSNLHFLNLSENQLSSIPAELYNLFSLNHLDISNNQLTGTIPVQLFNIRNLGYLSLDNNQLTGSIPPEIGNLSNLHFLNLSENQLSGSIPAELGKLTKLQSLDLSSNQLTGTIPAELGTLSILEGLNLFSNQLSGSIPPELGNLINLYHLDFSNNQLSSSIPAELNNLIKMNHLDFSNNQLSGSIPAEIGNYSNLNWLNLHNNQLSGSIPAELGNLRNLYYLYLDNNQLTGPIPLSFTNCEWIHDLDLSYNCLYATDATLRAWLDIHDPDWELHQNNCISPKMSVTPASIHFGATTNGFKTDPQNIYINNSGIGILVWTASPQQPFISCIPASGAGSGIISVSVNTSGLTAGTYHGSITVSAPDASNSPQTITVTLTIYNNSTVPFGEFATPLDGANVQSSIPVTGWALDDIGVQDVKIYRTEGNGLAYIGDAVFVEGARPDVAAAYPDYPLNTRAGWGYMLLTNFLPNGGNGTYTLHAIATDMEGRQISLGTKTITVDNAHAVKPFGAIDTPAQGGTASGTQFINWGWALTPQPNHIPTNGSTLSVWVDGVPIGHPTYNGYREDIATLFPGYANSTGAIGYFYLDTTRYSNGVHSIAWSATDNAGNTDGIGSRYFSIQNTGYDAAPANQSQSVSVSFQNQIRSRSLSINELSTLPIEQDMGTRIIKEIEPIEIPLGKNFSPVQGYIVNNNELNPLPIGSTLDTKTGTFYWIPGPGFLGKYSLVFIGTDANGQILQKTLEIEIVPKY